MNTFTLTVLAISIIMQLGAAIFALRLNHKYNSNNYGWLFVAAALTLMAMRRIVTFIGFFVPQIEATVKGPLAESIALLIAIFMLVGVLLISRFFDNSQQTTAALQASEARYRALVDFAEDIIFSLDRNGRYTSLNASSLQRFNLTETDIVGKSIHDLYPPEEAALYEQQHKKVFATGKPTHFEVHTVNEFGNFWFSISISPILDTNSQVIAISGIARDITERKQAEEQLQLQAAALEAAANGIVITDCEGIVSWVNPAFTQLTGYSSKDMLGQTLRLLKSGKQDPSTYKKLWETIQSGQVWHDEMINRRKDGSYYTEEQTITPVRDTDNEITHFITITQDITARKQLEQQTQILHKTADRRASELAVLMRLGHAISANIDLETILETTYQSVGELMDNDAFWISSYVSGAEHSQYLIKIDREVRHPLDQFSIHTGIGGYVIRTKEPALMDRSTIQDKFRLARYGNTDPVESILCVPLQIGKQIIGVMSTQSYTSDAYSEKELTLLTKLAQPVAVAMENARLFNAERAARKQAETLQEATQALSRSLRLSQVFEMILSELQQVVPYDSATVQQLKGDKLEIIGGYGFPNLDELLGVRFDLTIGNNPNREVVSTQAPFIVDDAPTIYRDFSVDLHAQAGIRSWLGVPLLFGDRLIGMLALDKQKVGFYTQRHAHLALGFAAQAAIAIENAQLYDQLRTHANTLEQRVTERTQELGAANERLKELDRLKSKFVSDVSHELRTPVTNLRMYLDLLARGQAERHTHYLTILQEQADLLQHLIEDILDLSRLEMIKDTKIKFATVDLNKLVAQVVSTYQPRAEAANLHFAFEQSADLTTVQGERNQLIQVVTNLVSNALNYTPNGDVQLCTYLDLDQVCLQIEDTGMGIASEDLPHLFERFYRGQHVNQVTIPGTGLGLAIVKEIVDLHHGKIEVRSEVGKGTVFRVWLPVST